MVELFVKHGVCNHLGSFFQVSGHVGELNTSDTSYLLGGTGEPAAPYPCVRMRDKA